MPTPKPAPRADAWEIPPINCNEPEDGVFYAQMGPTGGKHGYSAITGNIFIHILSETNIFEILLIFPYNRSCRLGYFMVY